MRTETKHKAVKAATSEQLKTFLTTWPYVDPQTGLSIDGDELLIKAREAMIAAVHVFNGAGLTFRAELFITTTIIAWTYLLHSWFRREGIDYRYRVPKRSKAQIAIGNSANVSVMPAARYQRAPSRIWISCLS